MQEGSISWATYIFKIGLEFIIYPCSPDNTEIIIFASPTNAGVLARLQLS